MKKTFLIALLIVPILWFFNEEFRIATNGWFQPSINQINITLISVFAIILLLFLSSDRLVSWIKKLSLFFFVLFAASYLAFILVAPSAGMVEIEGIIIGLSYAIGKYGLFISGVISILRLLRNSKVGGANLNS